MVLVRHHAGKKIERVQNEILGIWLEKHPFEKLVDGEELTRRGESFLLDVYLPWKREVKYLGLKKFTDRIELLKKKDEKWTQKNLEIVFEMTGEEWNDDNLFDRDLTIKTLQEKFNLDKEKINEAWKEAKKKNNGLAFEANGERYFSLGLARQIIKEKFLKEYLSARSRWIAQRWNEKCDKKMNVDERLWNWKRKKVYTVKNTTQPLRLVKDIPEVGELTSVGELRNAIETYHPCEMLVIKKDGEYYFTEKGYVWFFTQFIPNFEILGSTEYTKKEIEFTKGWMASKQIKKRNVIVGSWNDVGTQYEMMGADVWSMYHIVMQVDLNSHTFSVNDILKVEKEFPMLELNALSKWIGPTDQKEFNVNALVVKKSKNKKRDLTTSYWTEIHDLKSESYYSGRIMNRPYSYYDRKHREVLVVNVMLEDKRQVKVRLPNKQIEKRCLIDLMEPLCPFQFYVASVDKTYKRVEKIMPCMVKWYEVIWDENFSYVPIPHRKEED